jgi:stage II sporulation protein P
MAHMKLKKISPKKKLKFFFLLLLVYLTIAYTFYNSFKNNNISYNKEFISFLLDNGSPTNISDYKIPKILNKTITYLLKVDLSNPSTILNNSVLGYSYDEPTNLDLDKLKQISSYIEDPYKVDITNPLIYLYNSHQLENYNNDSLLAYGITPNVLMASYLLKEKLNSSGLGAIVEDTNMTEFLSLNNWDYSSSYKASRIFLLDKQNTHPTIKYYFDIHRDSVNKKLTTVNINNKSYARILFVVGLEHSNYQENLKNVNKLNSIIDKKYPGLSRGIYKKEGPGVNGIYNQDISSKVFLIELGGIDNNIEEVLNTINALTDTITTYINQNEKE